MAVTTVTVRQRARPNLATILRSFSFTFSVSGATLGARGITHDGAHLWISTTAAAGRVARMLQIDPNTGTVVANVSTGAGTASWLDIAFDGQGFYVLDDAGGRRLLHYIRDPSGASFRRTRLLNSSLPANARSIEFDGYFIYVGVGASAAATTIYVYDPVTGAQIRSFSGATVALGATGPGITHDGYYLIERGDPALYAVYYFATDAPVPTGILVTAIITGGSDDVDDQAPIVMELQDCRAGQRWRRGYNVYDFKSDA